MFRQPIQIRVLARHERRVETLAQRRELLFQHAAVREFQDAHARVVGAGDHRSERCFNPSERDRALDC